MFCNPFFSPPPYNGPHNCHLWLHARNYALCGVLSPEVNRAAARNRIVILWHRFLKLKERKGTIIQYN